MESVNVFRGYGKVSEVEAQSLDRNPTRKKKPLIIAVTFILILTLTFAIALAVSILAHHHSNQEQQEEAEYSLISIKRVCRVTPHPDSCFSAVSSFKPAPKPDPDSILKVSLHVALKDLSETAASVRKLNDARSESALRDCVDQFDDALSRLNDSVAAAMEVVLVSTGEKNKKKKKMVDEVKNMQTWISAAMTDEETCVDGLEEMGSAVADQVKDGLLSSKQSISNTLAIVANIKDLLRDFNLKLH